MVELIEEGCRIHWHWTIFGVRWCFVVEYPGDVVVWCKYQVTDLTCDVFVPIDLHLDPLAKGMSLLDVPKNCPHCLISLDWSRRIFDTDLGNDVNIYVEVCPQ